jgi:hypothetical protein
VEFDFEANIHLAGLKARDPRWKMRIGKYYGLPYIELKRGKWNIQLKYEDLARWAIQRRSEQRPDSPFTETEIDALKEKNQNPHWKWIVTAFGHDGVSEQAMGRVPELYFDSDPAIISNVIRFIAEDPCLVPEGRATTGFACPECKGDWNVPQFYPMDQWRKDNEEHAGLSLEDEFLLEEANYWPLEPNIAKVGDLPLIADLFKIRND